MTHVAGDRAGVTYGGRRGGPRRSRLIQAGLPLLGAGVAVDGAYHAAPALASHAEAGTAGHLVTLVGMVLTVAGVMLSGLRRRPARRQQ